MHKLTLSLLLVVLISILGLGWTLDSLFEYFSAESPQSEISPFQEMGATLARIIDQDNEFEALIKRLKQDNDIHLNLSHLDEFPLPDEIRPSFLGGETLTLESRGAITLNYYLKNKHQVLTLSSPSLVETKESSPLSLIFTVAFYGGIIALLLVWLYPLVQQLIKLKQSAQAFGEGDLNQRVSKNSFSYIADIEDAFNQMAQQIQTLVSDNKLLSNAVSHDLRTPLARLRFGIDALSEVEDIATREKYQKRISQDVDEMESLVETLLNYARLDQSMIALEKKPVNLVTIVDHCISHADKSSVKINVKSAKTKIIVNGDESYLVMLLNNILSNALEHASSLVLISISEIRTTIHLTIEDNGKGISEDEKERVLKPFVRGKSATTKGYGMGLAISKRIAEWHAGSVEIKDSNTLGGAKVCVLIPKADK